MKRPDVATITFHKRRPREASLVIVTPDAARQIATAAKTADAGGLALRIAASLEADGSLDYAMGFDNARQGDIALTSEGIALVVAEEHLVDGGVGVRVAQVVAETVPCPMEFVGIHDTYAESGRPDELLEKYGLTSQYIARAAERVIARKR